MISSWSSTPDVRRCCESALTSTRSPAEQPEFRAAPRRCMGCVARRAHRAARRLCGGRRRAEHDGGQRHRGQPAVRHAAGGVRHDSARQRAHDDAARRAGAGDRRSGIPQCVAAVVERERAAAARPATWRRWPGYFGSRGKDLRISRNINQPVNGVRPFSALSPASPILPGAPLGNITQVESTGFSSYHAMWVSATKRPSRGLAVRHARTRGRSRSTPIRSIHPASPSRTATTSRTSTACRTSTPVTGSCSAPPTSCRSPVMP